MKQQAKILALTLLMVIALDAAVAGVLAVAERQGRLGSLVQYFEYGRSVPGKIDRWRERPGIPGNLLEVAWRDDILATSREGFAAEQGDPVVRSYGMSFVDQILQAAQEQEPGLTLDLHAGPSAPPNFTYTLFQDDAANRRAGDVVVLGILSSSVSGMAALSNRTWIFEQPAPFTYPIYEPEDGGLIRIDPLVATLEDEEALQSDPEAAAAWKRQLREDDRFYSPVTFAATWLDHSPFLRLVRRASAVDMLDGRSRAILAKPSSGGFPYRETLRRMVTAFADRARADGQHPVVFLIQSRDPTDPDLRVLLGDVLTTHDIPFLATADHYDIRNPVGFLDDGHYTDSVNLSFARQFNTLFGTPVLE